MWIDRLGAWLGNHVIQDSARIHRPEIRSHRLMEGIAGSSAITRRVSNWFNRCKRQPAWHAPWAAAGRGREDRTQGLGKGRARSEEVGIFPSVSPKFPVVSMPWGLRVPRALDGLVVGWRHISCDANSHGFMREIPQCWLTGRAAGVGAALAADMGVQPREVPVEALRRGLRQQGAHLGDDAVTLATIPAEATMPAK